MGDWEGMESESGEGSGQAARALRAGKQLSGRWMGGLCTRKRKVWEGGKKVAERDATDSVEFPVVAAEDAAAAAQLVNSCSRPRSPNCELDPSCPTDWSSTEMCNFLRPGTWSTFNASCGVPYSAPVPPFQVKPTG